MLLANVILATQIPYVMALMFCFLVVPIEAAILYAMERPAVGFGRSIGLVIAANIVSWIAGVVIMFLIPVPMSYRTNESQPPYFHGIIVGFIVAYFLSWAIEYWVISRFRRFPFRRLTWSTGLANAASYAAVFVAMMAMG
jgi:hypothetical protein